ncbi:MAG: ribosome biogenesis factor YjgA [Pseudomonadota bacterium]
MKNRADIRSEKPSKSARKRDAQRVRKLVDTLVAMKATALGKIPLSDDVRDQIRQARQMTAHGALRRQKQYIARLLRDTDIEPIEQALDTSAEASNRDRRRFRRAERWRDRLLSGKALDPSLAAALSDDVLKSLDSEVSAYHATQVESRRKQHSRSLFRLLHAALDTIGEDRHDG